ncbi:MAG: O-phosphoserine--tRNA ligase [Candidatus Hodarchaeota archaeon]
MTKLNIQEILRKAEEDYEKAWADTVKLLKGRKGEFRLKKGGKTHPVLDFIQKARKALVELGFEEMILPVMVRDEEVYKEYGPEAAVILDRVFYLAVLPRADIGLSKKKVEEIRKIIPGFDKIEELKNILREYKIGEINADDLIELMFLRLGISEEQATKIIDSVFTEFKGIKPRPTDQTLRSHMTALWFPVLAEIQHKSPLPIQLFTVGEKFRREQKLDPTHLYSSYTVSYVVLSDQLSLEDGMRIAEKVLNKLGFEQVRFEIKKTTSKYYAPGTEFEIFVHHPITKSWIELGDGGFYSPISLAKFGIEYPVLNTGFGAERCVMIQTGEGDIRKLVYPYFYKEIEYSDKEIAGAIKIKDTPQSRIGKEIMRSIIRVAEENKDKISPAEFTAWTGEVKEKHVKVTVWENDLGVKLLGPAALNQLWVLDGNIIGVIPSTEVSKRGVYTGIRYLDSIAAAAAKELENLIERGEGEIKIRIRISKQPSDVNIDVDGSIRRYIMSKNNKIDIRGPVFVGITGLVKPAKKKHI